MGSFVKVYGDPKITDPEKKEAFIEGAKKLIHEGGMMQFETVNMFGKEIALIHPPEVDEDGEIYFHYNYFGDCAWETAGLDTKKARFWSEKKGSQQFSDVVIAIHMLQDMYADGYSFTTSDGEFFAGDYILGWINYVLETSFTCDDRIKTWELYEALHEDKWCDEEDEIWRIKELFWELSPEGRSRDLGAFLTLEYFSDKERLFEAYGRVAEEEQDESKKKLNTIDRIRRYEKVVSKIISEYGNSDDNLNELMAMLKYEGSERLKRYNDDAKAGESIKQLYWLCAFESSLIPCQTAVRILADAFEKDFWELWDKVKDDAVDMLTVVYPPDALRESSEKDNGCICNTADYLAIPDYVYRLSLDRDYDSDYHYDFSDDDRLYWWKPEGNVKISEDMKKWFEELKERYLRIVETEKFDLEDMDFLKWMLELLDDADNTFRRIHAFNTQYYEFLMHSADDRFRALLKLFEELIEENREEGSVIERLHRQWWDLGDTRIIYNPARLRIKRYLALIANKELRKEVFGF